MCALCAAGEGDPEQGWPNKLALEEHSHAAMANAYEAGAAGLPCAIFRGYNADIARRAVFGRPSDDQRRQHDLIWGIASACIAAVAPGARASDVARVCNEQMRRAGYPELVGPKRVGHGIGLDPSEPPSLSLADQTVLEPGMVVTPEPRIDLPSGERLHVEEDIVVSAETPEGHEWLSRGAAELATIGA